MSDRDALLAAILANPDEDTPRLMFADWLDENGDSPRAEFIRVQIELALQRAAEADLPDNFGTSCSTGGEWPMCWRPHDTEERRVLLRRETALLMAHSEEWRKGLPKFADNGQTRQSVKFRRGFVGRVCVALGTLTKSPADLWAHHPVESLVLLNCAGEARNKVPKCRPLAAVRELRFIESDITPEILAPFADCPHLSGLRELDFPAGGVADAAARVLARSPHLKPVTLEIACHAMKETGFAELLNGPFASRLRRLRATGAGAVTWGAHVVAAAPLTELRRLDLWGGSCGDAGAIALTESKHLVQLVSLNLSQTGITNGALQALARWPGLSRVQALNLGDNKGITARGAVMLVKSPHLNPIFLGLRGTSVGDEGAKALAAWPGLANLIDLDLSSSCLSDVGLGWLADSPHWRDIRYLKVSGNGGTNGPSAHRLRDRLGAPKLDIMPY